MPNLLPSTSPVAIICSVSRDGRSAVVKVPYEYRGILQSLGWRKWDPKAKAWKVLRQDLPHLVANLEAAGCAVRWRGGNG